MLSIIGCGNLNRRDDGVGVYVVRQLKCKLADSVPSHVRIFDAGTAGMDVMFQARGSKALIIVDASRSGAEPGAIFQVPGEELQREHSPSFGLHDFRWDHALYAGRQIYKDDFPSDVQVFLIEALDLEYGVELTEVVKLAGDKVVDKIIDTLTESVSIKNGNLYVDCRLYEKFFAGIETVALLRREEGFLVMPVFSQASGGRLMKMRNTAGDRVITATDFLQQFDLSQQETKRFLASWDSQCAALFVDLNKPL